MIALFVVPVERRLVLSRIDLMAFRRRLGRAKPLVQLPPMMRAPFDLLAHLVETRLQMPHLLFDAAHALPALGALLTLRLLIIGR